MNYKGVFIYYKSMNQVSDKSLKAQYVISAPRCLLMQVVWWRDEASW